MLKKLLVNALIPPGLAVALYFFFMTTKHDAALSAIMPFAFDPYDAIGSFAVETAIFLSILSLIRAIRLYRKDQRDVAQQLLLARTQMGIVLAAFLTLAGDAVAMLRHIPQWTGHAATNELVLLFAGLMLLTLGVGMAVFVAARRIGLPQVPHAWEKGVVIFVAMIVILAFYPENIIQSTVGELCTVIIGASLLFVPLWALGNALLPYTLNDQKKQELPVRKISQWVVVLLSGICIGLLIVLAESREGGNSAHIFQIFSHIRVVLIYVVLEVSAVLIGYSLLRKQLGLFWRG